MKASELKLCPNCGSSDLMQLNKTTTRPMSYVACCDCLIEIRFEKADFAAQKAWNELSELKAKAAYLDEHKRVYGEVGSRSAKGFPVIGDLLEAKEGYAFTDEQLKRFENSVCKGIAKGLQKGVKALFRDCNDAD